MSKPRFIEFNSPAQIPLTASGQTSIWSQSYPVFQTPNMCFPHVTMSFVIFKCIAEYFSLESIITWNVLPYHLMHI